MTRPQALFALQQVDTEIDSRLTRISRVDAALHDDREVREAKETLENAEKGLRAANSYLKDIEYQSDEAKSHADKLEQKLYGGDIKGGKEAEKAQSEIAAFRARRKELEDHTVSAMAQLEAQTQLVQQAKERLAAVQAEADKNKEALQAERTNLEAELPSFRAEREKRKQMVVSPDLVLYEKLRSTKNGIAVAQAEVSGKLCGKCRADLPPAKTREVKNPNAIVTCPSCGRILFYK